MDGTAHSSSQADSHRRADGVAQIAPCRLSGHSRADHTSAWTTTTAHAPLLNAITTPPTLQSDNALKCYNCECAKPP